MKEELTFEDGTTEIHFSGLANNYTLCGFDTEGADVGDGSYGSKSTNKKVDCKSCIEIVKFCRKLRIT